MFESMKKNNLNPICFSFIFSLLSYFLFLLPANAFASSFSVGIYPPISKITQETQTTSTIPIYLQNYDADNPVDLNFQIRPFVPSNKFDGQAVIVPQTTTLNADYQNLLSHIKITDGDTQISKLILSPTQRKQVTLTIDIPKDFPQGDYYFSFIAKSDPFSLDDTNISSIIGGVASNVILTVGQLTQTEKPNGIIQNFSAPIFLLNGPVPISLLVENTAKNVFSPKGNVVIKNIYGQTVGALNLLPVNILSHSSRYVPDVNSDSETQIIWNEKILLGIYSARLTLALSDQGPVFQRTIYFLAAPIKLLLVLGLIIIVFITILTRVIKNLKENTI